MFLDGERVPDVTADPGLGHSARIVARGYDALHRPGEDARNPAFTIPEPSTISASAAICSPTTTSR